MFSAKTSARHHNAYQDFFVLKLKNSPSRDNLRVLVLLGHSKIFNRLKTTYSIQRCATVLSKNMTAEKSRGIGGSS